MHGDSNVWMTAMCGVQLKDRNVGMCEGQICMVTAMCGKELKTGWECSEGQKACVENS